MKRQSRDFGPFEDALTQVAAQLNWNGFDSSRACRIPAGMSEVWIVDVPRGRYVCKILAPRLMNQRRFRGRFQQEVEILCALSSTAAVPTVCEADAAGEPPWHVTTFIQGWDLAECLSGARKRLALKAMPDIIQAIKAAASLHITHRDISLQNLRVTSDGRGMVLDWGIAYRGGGLRSTQADLRYTEPDRVHGTHPFRGPEQSMGSSDIPDVRNDIFSLAGVLSVLSADDSSMAYTRLAQKGISHQTLVRDIQPRIGPASTAILMQSLEPRKNDRSNDLAGLLEITSSPAWLALQGS